MVTREDKELSFPPWFTRMVIGTIFGLGMQFCGGIWWAATLTAKVDNMNQNTSTTLSKNEDDIDDLQDDMKVVEDKIANLKKDLAVLLDRGGTVRTVKE